MSNPTLQIEKMPRLEFLQTHLFRVLPGTKTLVSDGPVILPVGTDMQYDADCFAIGSELPAGPRQYRAIDRMGRRYGQYLSFDEYDYMRNGDPEGPEHGPITAQQSAYLTNLMGRK